MGWSAAVTVAEKSSFAGHSDWRLPNKQELESLVDDTCHSPAINDVAFPNTVQQSTWTSTTVQQDPSSATVVNFYTGTTYTVDKTDPGNIVRLVREGDSYDSLLVDTTPPDTSITSGPTTGPATSVTISFTGSDNVAVARYECKLDAAPFATCSSPYTSPTLSLGLHAFNVRAIDTAGNVDPTPASVNWMVTDGTPPTTQITSTPPPDGPAIAASISFTGQDNFTQTVSFECQLDNAAYDICTSPQNLTNLSLGLHTFRVRAKDAALNVDPNPASVTWRVTWTCAPLDIDGSDGPTAEVDAIIILRYLFGFRGDALIAGLTPLQGLRTTAGNIEVYLDGIVGTQLEVFGRQPAGQPTATGDGLVLARLMQGVPDAALLTGVAVPAGAQNGTAAAIRSAINNRCAAAQ